MYTKVRSSFDCPQLQRNHGSIILKMYFTTIRV